MTALPLKLGNKVIIERCFLAHSFFSRFLGLMGRTHLPSDEAVLFPKCNSLHTFFMRFPIDVVFTSRTGEVIEVIEALPAWRMLLPRLQAKHALELMAGRAKKLGIDTGCVLQYEGVFL